MIGSVRVTRLLYFTMHNIKHYIHILYTAVQHYFNNMVTFSRFIYFSSFSITTVKVDEKIKIYNFHSLYVFAFKSIQPEPI